MEFREIATFLQAAQLKSFSKTELFSGDRDYPNQKPGGGAGRPPF